MNLSSSALDVTTGLMAAFAVFIIYIRIKNWLDSNVPIIFYVILAAYMRSVEGRMPRTVPLWLILVGLGLTLLMRFEFMNTGFTRFVKTLELGVLAVMIYICGTMILQF